MLQVIMLLLGGFAIAGALSKHFIAKSMATAILSRVGRQPHWVLLANMLVATFLSMFISNVAAPVLCFGLVQPILRTYAAGQSCSFVHLLARLLIHSSHPLTHSLPHSLTHSLIKCMSCTHVQSLVDCCMRAGSQYSVYLCALNCIAGQAVWWLVMVICV